MKYKITDLTYIGPAIDLAGHECHGFIDDNNIVIVYNLNEKNEYNIKEKINIIKNNLDKYIWTPFAIFVSQMESIEYIDTIVENNIKYICYFNKDSDEYILKYKILDMNDEIRKKSKDINLKLDDVFSKIKNLHRN